jgi:hypothetical protein
VNHTIEKWVHPGIPGESASTLGINDAREARMFGEDP